MDTDAFANELQTSITHTIVAHTRHPKEPKKAVRYWDMNTPYAIHPIWCAMTLLTETRLSAEVRHRGYQALLWHDTLEDTTLSLPVGTSKEVASLVQEMTFANFGEEVEKLWGRSSLAKLLKLYDKVSNLLDGTWMSEAKWAAYVEHTLKLRIFVMREYGELNITNIARAVCTARPPRE